MKAYFAVLPTQEEERAEARQHVESVLDKWLSYQSGCGLSQDYCDISGYPSPKDETEPLFGCSVFLRQMDPCYSFYWVVLYGYGVVPILSNLVVLFREYSIVY